MPVNEDADAETASPSQPRVITASLRAINRLLFSVAGLKANFRGLACALAIAVGHGLVGAILRGIPFIGLAGSLIAALALVQLETAWVHVVISNPSSLPFYRRLPPFGKTFEATCVPTLVYWVTKMLSGTVPLVVASALGLPVWEPRHGKEIPAYDSSVNWKAPLIALVSLAIYGFLVIPAQAVLVRVQASLLPPDEDAIVPFDRSFEGTVEPAIVGGKGYVTWRDSLRTFTRASWIRLYVLHVKTFFVQMALWVVFAAVVVPVVVLVAHKSNKAN